MPATAQAAIVFSLLVVPGFLCATGYRRGRSYTLPERDLYVLAQAVVLSLVWLAVVWFTLQCLGDPLARWGVLPLHTTDLARHRNDVAAVLVAAEVLPLLLGLLAGVLVNASQARPGVRALLGWTGLFESPTAWEHAWSVAAARAAVAPQGSRFVEVTVRLKSGDRVEGRYGADSRVDLAPRPSHHVYLETGFGVKVDRGRARLAGDGTIGGVFLDASEIASIYFRS